MEVLDHYSIPFMGLKIGVHQLKFEVDNDFFAQYEHTQIHEGSLEVFLKLDKRSDMSILDFDIEGHITAECDRCMEMFQLPVTASNRLHAKYSETPMDGDDEVVYIHSNESSFNVAQYIYEYIHLAIPLYKTHDDSADEKDICDPEITDQLEWDDEVKNSNPIWDKLNNLKFDK